MSLRSNPNPSILTPVQLTWADNWISSQSPEQLLSIFQEQKSHLDTIIRSGIVSLLRNHHPQSTHEESAKSFLKQKVIKHRYNQIPTQTSTRPTRKQIPTVVWQNILSFADANAVRAAIPPVSLELYNAAMTPKQFETIAFPYKRLRQLRADSYLKFTGFARHLIIGEAGRWPHDLVYGLWSMDLSRIESLVILGATEITDDMHNGCETYWKKTPFGPLLDPHDERFIGRRAPNLRHIIVPHDTNFGDCFEDFGSHILDVFRSKVECVCLRAECADDLSGDDRFILGHRGDFKTPLMCRTVFKEFLSKSLDDNGRFRRERFMKILVDELGVSGESATCIAGAQGLGMVLEEGWYAFEMDFLRPMKRMDKSSRLFGALQELLDVAEKKMEKTEIWRLLEEFAPPPISVGQQGNRFGL